MTWFRSRIPPTRAYDVRIREVAARVCAVDKGGLEWSQNTAGPGCAESPPVPGQPCSPPGNVCGYISGLPSSSDFITDFCCNGNSHKWEMNPSSGCPNGSVCGTIDASDYDQACSTDSDCTTVTEGNLCAIECACGNASINMLAQAQYQADFAKKTGVSDPLACPCPPPPGSPACDAGACWLSPVGIVEVPLPGSGCCDDGGLLPGPLPP